MDPARPASESSIAVSQSQAAATVPSRLGYFRWIICGLLLLGTTKNYMDRQVLGVLKTTLQHDFSWNEIQYGNKRRCDHHTIDRALDCVALGLAGSVRGNRRDRIRLALHLAADLSQAGRPQRRFEGGTGLHSKRSARTCGKNQMGSVVSASSDLGIRHGEIPD